MFSRKYECVIIFDVQLADAARDAILKDISGIIAGTGGEVVEVAPHGVRALATDLKGRTRGDYRIVRFTTGPETLQRVDRTLRMKEEVLRFMVTKNIPVKPRKHRARKPKPAKTVEPTPTEGEARHGKSEQGIPDREHHAPA